MIMIKRNNDNDNDNSNNNDNTDKRTDITMLNLSHASLPASSTNLLPSMRYS